VPGEEFDFVERIGMALPIFVIGKLLGIPQERHDDFRDWNGVLASLQTSAEQKREAHGLAFGYIGELIEAKRREPGDDLVSALIAAQEDGGSLLEQPEQQALLRADAGLLPGAVEEFLRLESPLNMATIRFTAEPVQLGTTVIPAGEIVFIALLSANRDPERFPDPDRLDVTRSNRGHLSFGHGIHHCIGAPLARMEGEIVFGRLLDRFPSWELAAPAESLRWKYSAQFRGLEALPLRLA
jgi:cytochrome P450